MPATYTDHSNNALLFVAFELGWTNWKLAFGTAIDGKAWQRTIPARDLEALTTAITKAKERFGVDHDTQVVSCYEAGRDGFWLHRYLRHANIGNLIVDSSSIEVNRRQRRVKCDRLDAAKLLTMLMRHDAGERGMWSVVNVPSADDEFARHLHRDLMTLKKDRARHNNRIKGWLAGCGLSHPVDRHLPETLPTLRLWDGTLLPQALQQRILREFARWQLANEQIRAVQREQVATIRNSTDARVEKVRRLQQLAGIGPRSAWLYVMEFFGWREIRNRRELAALAGLTPTTYASGDMARERGISKAGNRRIRAMAIEIAWGWLRFQPDSALTQWYRRRFGGGSARMKKIGIVAMARKLLIQLWQYLETGAIPDGARLKAA